MKTSEKLLFELRMEYMAVMEKVAAAKFALMTLSISEEENQLLTKQVTYMGWYADMLAERAKIIANRVEKKPTSSN